MIAGQPGTRFQERYRRRRASGFTPLKRGLYLVAGTVVIALGLFMLVAPGPGLLALFFGALLIAEQSLTAAKALDWLELKVRRLLKSRS